MWPEALVAMALAGGSGEAPLSYLALGDSYTIGEGVPEEARWPHQLARALRAEPPPESPAQAKRRVTVCVKAVAGLLGNTPTVCRSAYIHPQVFELYAEGRLAEALPGPDAQTFERALIRLLAEAA